MASKKYRRVEREPHDSVLEALKECGKCLAWTAKLINLSEGGASFSTKMVLKKSQNIHTRMRIFEKGVVEARGKVIWIKKKLNTNVYGIKFDSIKQRK